MKHVRWEDFELIRAGHCSVDVTERVDDTSMLVVKALVAASLVTLGMLGYLRAIAGKQ